MRLLLTLTLLLLSGALLSTPALAQSIAASAPSDSREPFAEGDYLILQTSERVTGDVAVFPSPGVPQYATANGQRYEMAQVRTYRLQGQEYTVLRGGDYAIQTGSLRPVLLVKRESGRINVYEEAAGGQGFAYIQTGDGPIQIQTSARLRAAFADDPQALHYLDRERTYGRYGFSAMAAGAALVATGAAIEFGNLNGPSGIVLAGSGILLAASVNSIVPILQGNARRSAIQVYNR